MALVRPHIQVHDQGERRLDAILRLLDWSRRPLSRARVLQGMCEEAAELVGADVVSLYVREGSPDATFLVMRANVGFPKSAIGKVRLRVGEGITGFAAECLRPVTAAVAQEESHYRHFPELGEENFPAFLALPIIRGEEAEAVIVFQRRADRLFSAEDVPFASALIAPFAYAIERAESMQAPAPFQGSARLGGVVISSGVVLGQAALVSSSSNRKSDRGPVSSTVTPHDLARALDALASQIARQTRALENKLAISDREAIRSIELVLHDGRFRQMLFSALETLDFPAAFERVAREYAGHSSREGSDSLHERATEVEEVCSILRERFDGADTLRRGAILVLPDRLTVIRVLLCAARGARAIVIAGPVAEHSLAARTARAAGITVMSDVDGLYAWIRPQQTLLVDGDRGLVLLSPRASEIASHRRDTRGK